MQAIRSRSRFTLRGVYLLVLLALTLTGEACKSRKHFSPRWSKAPQTAEQSLLAKYEVILGQPLALGSLPLYQLIDQWIGAPYKYGGTCTDGTDCSGFAMQLYKGVYNRTLPRSSVDQYGACTKVPKGSLQEGNLVFFAIAKGKVVSHVGVYLGSGKFVHASVHRGVCIDSLGSSYYSKYFLTGGTPK